MNTAQGLEQAVLYTWLVVALSFFGQFLYSGMIYLTLAHYTELDRARLLAWWQVYLVMCSPIISAVIADWYMHLDDKVRYPRRRAGD